MPILMPGDVFTTANPMWLGRAICSIERWNDVDKEASYSHAGFLISGTGATFEALWTNKTQNLFEAYAGKRVLIGRHEHMTPYAYERGWQKVRGTMGQWYPFHRLPLHIIPPLAKMLAVGKFAVCSELTARFLVGAGLLNFWAGVTPDYVADMIRRWKEWTVIWEGELPQTLEAMFDLPSPVPA